MSQFVVRLWTRCVGTLAAFAAGVSCAATHIVTPASDLQAVVNGATAGDVIRFDPGVYRTDCIDIFKRLTLISTQPHAAILQGTPNAPRWANDGELTAPPCAFNLARRTADGTRIEGLQFQYFSNGIYGKGVADLQIVGNRFVSNYGDGIALHDTADADIHHNAFLDPYLPGDQPASVDSYASNPIGVTDAQMDYGVAIYGSLRPRVHHNYFFGIFNQALSFKIANRDAYAGYNTFEGYNLTALFFGQEPSIDESFPVFGASGWESGDIVARGNVFRAVRGIHPGTQAYAEYRARSPIRIRFVDANVTVRDNVVESGITGIKLECSDTLCPRGKIVLRNNLVVGRVITADNAVHDIGGCAIDVHQPSLATVILAQNTLAYHRIGLCAQGGVLDVANIEFFGNREADVSGAPASIDYNNHFIAGPVLGGHSTSVNPLFARTPDLNLRTARLELTPDREFTAPFHLVALSPGLANGRGGTHRGAFGSIETFSLFRDDFEL